MEDPRLDLREVTELVATLAATTLHLLAAGPLEDGCRVCQVLRYGEPDSPGRRLFDWHKFFDETEALDLLTRKAKRDGNPEPLDDWVEIAGKMSYARCCTIYQTARLEIAERRRRGLPADVAVFRRLRRIAA
jgi:hypothetical protein